MSTSLPLPIDCSAPPPYLTPTTHCCKHTFFEHMTDPYATATSATFTTAIAC